MNKSAYILPLVFIAASINFHIFSELLVFDLQRCMQVIVVILLVVSCSPMNQIIGIGNAVWSYHASVIKILFNIGLGFLIGSILDSEYPVVAVKGTVNDLLLFITVFILAIYALNNRRFVSKAVAYAGLIGLGLYYFQFFVGFFAGVFSGTSIEREVLVHHFSNIRFLSHLQVLFFPFIFMLSTESDNRLIRYSALVISILTISILLFLSARAGLGCLCIAALILLRFSKKYRTYAKHFFGVLLTGLVFYLVCLKGFPAWWGGEVAPVRVNLTSSGRWDMWLESFELMKNNWFFGVGALHYSLVSSYGFGHPHNLFLQVGLEYGLVILGLLILLAIKFCFVLYKKLFRSDSHTIIACFPFLWSIIAITGVSMFSGVWMAPLTQILVVVCIAPLISVLIEDDSKLLSLGSSYTPNRLGVFFVRVLIFSAAFSLFVLVYSDVKLRFQGNVSSMQIKGIQIYAPRFWQEDVWLEK